MSEKKSTKAQSMANCVLISNIKNLQSAESLLEEINWRFNQCIRDGIIIISSKEQTECNILEVFSNLNIKFDNVTHAILDDQKNIKFDQLSRQMNELLDFWYKKFIPCFTPDKFFAQLIDDIISDLEKCTKSKNDGFRTNVQGEIDRFKLFKSQLSYTIGEEIQPFPSISPILPYNLFKDENYQEYFDEAILKSQDLEKFQEFKDLWTNIRMLSLYFEIFRLDKKSTEENGIPNYCRIQIYSNALNMEKNNH